MRSLPPEMLWWSLMIGAGITASSTRPSRFSSTIWRDANFPRFARRRPLWDRENKVDSREVRVMESSFVETREYWAGSARYKMGEPEWGLRQSPTIDPARLGKGSQRNRDFFSSNSLRRSTSLFIALCVAMPEKAATDCQ